MGRKQQNQAHPSGWLSAETRQTPLAGYLIRYETTIRWKANQSNPWPITNKPTLLICHTNLIIKTCFIHENYISNVLTSDLSKEYKTWFTISYQANEVWWSWLRWRHTNKHTLTKPSHSHPWLLLMVIAAVLSGGDGAAVVKWCSGVRRCIVRGEWEEIISSFWLKKVR